MVKFTTPAKLDGTKLTTELLAAGVTILSTRFVTESGYSPPMIDGNGDLWLDIDPADESKALVVVKAHKG